MRNFARSLLTPRSIPMSNPQLAALLATGGSTRRPGPITRSSPSLLQLRIIFLENI